VQQNVQITYALYKAVTNIIQRGEFYIIIFLNKLKIVENPPPPPLRMKTIKIKHLWLRLWGLSEIHRPLLCSLD
jgi:hypothetical protein